ncbi:MAG: hypothetical protein KJ950_14070 [Proteobacteria bacterium]|nr:hypothetical protein [Pseudomonadota bacterium]MBU1686667.1 hypothetical protein [Pseudomonadota bacterium]
MKKFLTLSILLLFVLVLLGCQGGGPGVSSDDPVVTIGDSTCPTCPLIVNSLDDQETLAGSGTMTLRAALAQAADSQPITFDPSLNGGIIDLSTVAEVHSMLKGEVMGMKDEPSGPVSYLVGYLERDYGRSALYARKNVVIDASALPTGITIAWTGGEQNPARVLAVYGNLTMTNVAVTGGWSVAEDLQQPTPCPNPDDPDDATQCSTRARGGAIAVWGTAQLIDCTLYDNHVLKPAAVPSRSRDSGAFGGGLYADIVELKNCIVSGNTVTASGVSGGGVFSVGGAESETNISTIERSAITGNQISGFMAYGGGVYSDGGGIGKRNTLQLINTTIARNTVDIAPTSIVPSFLNKMGYWRGGGVYMSNGSLYMQSCTVAENEVTGVPRIDSLDRPNLAGGIAATIGNAHAVEAMTIGHSIVVGNTVQQEGGVSYDQDIFTGSLLHFKSSGYNRFGVIDFSQLLVPVGVPTWESLSRKHYPKEGDTEGVLAADVLNLTDGITWSETIFSTGGDAGNLAVLHYQPRGNALDQIPASPYFVAETYAEYSLGPDGIDTFPTIMLDRIEAEYGLVGFAAAFTADFETFLQTVDTDEETAGLQPFRDSTGAPILTLAEAQWFGPAETWPKELANYPYIEFWHQLDRALAAANIPGMGSELLDDAAWAKLFVTGALPENPEIMMTVTTSPRFVVPQVADQLGSVRPANTLSDIGAIEIP